MALQRFTRRAAEAAQGTGEAKDALAQMGIALRDQSGNLRRSEDLLGDVADAFAGIEDPAERVRLAFKLFDSEGVALVNLLRDGNGALDEMRERARDLGIVLDEHLVRDAERARTESPTLGFTTFIDTAQINALERKLDELRRARDQTQARIAFLEGPPDTGAPAPALAPASDDTAGVQDRTKNLERIARELEGTLFNITHEGSARIIAEHERRVAEIEALRARDGSNAEAVNELIAQSAAVRDAQLELYVDGFSRASSTTAATNTSALFGIYRWGWGFSTSQDFNGDIALIACFASSWTPAMVRRWHADPFGFLRPWNELPALMGSAPPATPPSTGTGVVVCIMG
jgi:hypothetical protein